MNCYQALAWTDATTNTAAQKNNRDNERYPAKKNRARRVLIATANATPQDSSALTTPASQTFPLQSQSRPKRKSRIASPIVAHSGANNKQRRSRFPLNGFTGLSD